MKLRVGFDTEDLGAYVIRDGKIDCVSETEGGRMGLQKRLEMHAQQMVELHGHNPDKMTAEDVLRFINEHSSQGRSWTVLEE